VSKCGKASNFFQVPVQGYPNNFLTQKITNNENDHIFPAELAVHAVKLCLNIDSNMCTFAAEYRVVEP
jgi:hypothetical protein